MTWRLIWFLVLVTAVSLLTGLWPAGSSPEDLRPPLRAERAQQRAMTSRVVLAVAPHREIGVVRQRREQVEGARIIRFRHLRAEPAEVGLPVAVRGCALAGLHGLHARRKVRVPDVVPVAAGKSGLNIKCFIYLILWFGAMASCPCACPCPARHSYHWPTRHLPQSWAPGKPRTG